LPIVLALFAFLFYSTNKNIKDRALDEFDNYQLTLAKQASLGIENFIFNYQRELVFLSKLKIVSDLDDPGKNLLREFYNNHSDQIKAISIVDSTGKLAYTYPYDKDAVGKDISDQEHVNALLKTHKPVLSEVFLAVQGYRAIAYHIPIIDGEKFKGSIAILIPIDLLGKLFIRNIHTGVSGFGCLLSKDNIVLYSPDEEKTGKTFRESCNDTVWADEILSAMTKNGTVSSTGSSVISKGKGINFKSTITSFYRVDLGNTYWTILAFAPEMEVFSTLKSLRNRLYILFGAIAMGLIIYFYLVFKTGKIITEESRRRSIEDILLVSENRFRVIFELSPAGIILIDPSGSIIEVNTAFCDTLGYTREELITKNIRMFASPESSDEIDRNIEKILKGITLKHEVKNLRKDGTACDIALYETMILFSDGNPGILSVSNDITEKKKVLRELIISKEKAEESDRLKSTFLTNMSHELRTPLNAIIGFSSFMFENGKDEETTTYSKIIFESGQHLLKLVEDILDTSLIEIGHMKVKHEKTDLISLLNDVKNIITGEGLRENKTYVEIILTYKQQEKNKIIITDSRKLKQILINLLKNSLKYTDEGYVEFGFSEIKKGGKNYLKFFVKDTGIGIDKKFHEVIFNLFRQVDETYTRKQGGTGLGLSIVKSFVEMLGGEIWLDSEPGKGSVFSFTIPELGEDSGPAGNNPDSTSL
jgi:PAS domain S-box-containing protein